MLRSTIHKVLTEYPRAITERFAGNSTVAFIQNVAPGIIANILPAEMATWICQGSAGQGKFSFVPWFVIMDPLVTTSVTAGYYVGYLFNQTNNSVYLTLNQGTTNLREEFLSNVRNILRDRAAIMRHRVQELANQFDLTPIDLGADGMRPRDYQAGHVFGRQYFLDSLPDEEQLVTDLHQMLWAYHALTFRGGVSSDIDDAREVSVFPGSVPLTILEKRQYKLHKRIERNARGGRLAKQIHGTTCQVCCFNFEAIYGEIGKDFIEAHHLKPLSVLAENVVVEYNIATDFAVLCPNCHRMIHHMEDVSDISGLKNLLNSTFC